MHLFKNTGVVLQTLRVNIVYILIYFVNVWLISQMKDHWKLTKKLKIQSVA